MTYHIKIEKDNGQYKLFIDNKPYGFTKEASNILTRSVSSRSAYDGIFSEDSIVPFTLQGATINVDFGLSWKKAAFTGDNNPVAEIKRRLGLVANTFESQQLKAWEADG